MDDIQGGHFQRPTSDGDSGTDQASPPARTKRKKHKRPEKLRDRHPPDPTRHRHRYNTRSAHSVDIDDDLDPDTIFGDPTEPTDAQQQQFLRSRDPHISDQPDSFVYFKDNGECVPDPIWKEFEVTLQDENGDPRIDDEGNPIKVIAPPPQDLLSRVFLTKPDERGEVKRARVVELIDKFDSELAKDPDRIKFKIAFDDDAQDDIMAYNEILDYVERECNNEDGHHWKFRTILGHTHTPVGHHDRMGNDYNTKTGWETGALSI